MTGVQTCALPISAHWRSHSAQGQLTSLQRTSHPADATPAARFAPKTLATRTGRTTRSASSGVTATTATAGGGGTAQSASTSARRREIREETIRGRGAGTAAGSVVGGTTTGMSTASPSGGAAAPVPASAGILLAMAETMIVAPTGTADHRNPSTGALCFRCRASYVPGLTRFSDRPRHRGSPSYDSYARDNPRRRSPSPQIPQCVLLPLSARELC